MPILRTKQAEEKRQTFLVRVPRIKGNASQEMEAFFSDLHRQLISPKGISSQERTVSFEMALIDNFLHFFFNASLAVSNLVIGQVYAHFPGAEIVKRADYTQNLSKEFSFVGTDLRLEKKDIYPIKTYKEMVVDSLIGFSGVMSKITEKQTQLWFQLVISPVEDTYLRQLERWFKRVVRLKIEPQRGHQVSLEKFAKYYFKTKLRLGSVGKDESEVCRHLDAFVHSLDAFDNGAINGLEGGRTLKGTRSLLFYQKRKLGAGTYYFNVEELASLYHFPEEDLSLANVVRVLSKKSEPPQDLPKAQFLKDQKISTFAVTNFRDEYLPFGIKREDRRRHIYIVGKTGVGKSKLLQLLMLSDIAAGQGFAVLDPHGDLVEEILRYIPQERLEDIIYFNPADEKYPVAFNPLEAVEPAFKQQVVTGFVAIFKKLFGFDWTSRLEHMLRYTTLALLDREGSTIVDIIGLLTDKTFRQEVVAQIKDPVVKNFWTHEFATWNEKFDNEAIMPLLNKVGEFISDPLVRNCVGQRKSSFNFQEVMDKQKILLMNLSSGKLGEDNAALLGSMIVTHIQQAAMARARLPEEKRKDFYLYVDEFQNFATSAFSQIFSEARKYRLCLTVAHQYIGQLTEEIKKTVFGNVGSLVVFRVGSEDAQTLGVEVAPVFTPEDMINLDSRDMYLKISIDGKTCLPFSARTVTFPKPTNNLSQEIVAHSRTKYAAIKNEIEEKLNIWQQQEAVSPKEEIKPTETMVFTAEKMEEQSKPAPKPSELEFEEPII